MTASAACHTEKKWQTNPTRKTLQANILQWYSQKEYLI